MLRTSARGALLAAAIGLALSLPACGKKAPLRLIEDQPPEDAPPLRAQISEGRVTLAFRVPAHRPFPEREDPWVLARILRQAGRSSEVVEAGAMLKTGGFVFDSPQSWIDQDPPTKSSCTYRVEFRDAARRRRALSKPLVITWELLPGAPSNLNAAGHLRSIILHWTPPQEAETGITYRIYRRVSKQTQFEQAVSAPVADSSFLDSRIEKGLDYCYVVRAVLTTETLEAEGPASTESCSRAAAEEPPQAPPPGKVP